MLSRRKAAVVLLTLAACAGPSDEHAAQQVLTARLDRLREHVDPREWLDDAARDTARAGNRAVALLVPGPREVDRMQRALVRHGEDMLATTPRRMQQGLARAAATAGDELARVDRAMATTRALLDPGPAARRLRAAAARVPTMLDFDREPLPSRSERAAGNAAAAPRESWLQRALRRIPP